MYVHFIFRSGFNLNFALGLSKSHGMNNSRAKKDKEKDMCFHT